MARPDTSLRGKVAVVTGSTRGIGLIIAAYLARAGANIVICGRTMESVEEAYQQFAVIPGVEVLGWACDVRNPDEVQSLAEQAVARFGKIDIWFNNAGISGPFAPTAEMPPEAWREVIDTNLIGTFHGTRVALQQMLPRNSGKIINLVGQGARERDRLHGYLSAYASSKAGVLRFTQAVSREYADTNLSILAMAPGFVRTGLMEPDALTHDAAERLKALDSALRRFGTPIEEAGELAVQLAGPATDGVTGKLYEVKPGLLQVLRGLLRRGG
ncbi:MAG TPA: SDR family oxidoreductase [Ardenticatenaceae bacterium]|jgi:NAD(P)-dependent dehydrogenase (short-subunit alcohol dehydrogenase family)